MRHRLLSLEAGRFIAALLVACFHFSFAFQNLRGVAIFGMAFRAGHAGVEYFFVLSGFIIYFIHARDIGAPQSLRPFVLKRFIRLYPIFWIVWLGLLLIFLAPSSLQEHRALAPGSLLLDVLLLPTSGATVIQQSWSLRHEIVFYVFFAVAILDARIGSIAILLWQLAVIVVGVTYLETLPLWLKPFFYIYNIGFGIGMATAWAASRWNVRHPGVIAAAGVIAFASCMVCEWAVGRNMPSASLPLGDLASPLLYLVASATIIFGLTRVEMAKPLPGQGVLRLLGGSSYVLYLLHTSVGSIVIRVFGISVLARVPNAIVFIAMVAAAVFASLMVHVWVEKPLLAWLRRSLLSKGPGPLTSPRVA